MKETWKDIPDYEGKYQVSDYGRVRAINYNPYKMIKLFLNKRGYYDVGLWKYSKRKLIAVHQLVAIVFLGHKPNGYNIVVDHVNNDKTDNRLTNLQLITHRENCSKDKWRYDKQTKYVGVHKSLNKFTAMIVYKGKLVNLGVFNTQEEARAHYLKNVKAIESGETLIIKRATHSSKYRGVNYCKRKGLWTARIMVNKKSYFLGAFKTEDEAYYEYMKRYNDIQDGKEIIDRSKPKIKTSKYKGVGYNKNINFWIARKQINNKSYFLGRFKTEDEAHEAYINFTR